MEQKIKASIVVEIMGRPKEHIVETMQKYIETMGKEKGIAVLSSKVHEPKKIEHKDREGKVIEVSEEMQLYTTFAEIIIEAENMIGFVSICMGYMPAHVEIFEPAELKMNNFEINSILNHWMAKMHHYDAIAKAALTQNQALTNKLKELAAQNNPEAVREDKKPKKKK